jgi:hypothetical protein
MEPKTPTAAAAAAAQAVLALERQAVDHNHWSAGLAPAWPAFQQLVSLLATLSRRRQESAARVGSLFLSEGGRTTSWCAG